MKQIQIFPSITTIDSHSLKSYLNEVSRIPCPTPEEEANLASLILEGGKEGRLAKSTFNVKYYKANYGDLRKAFGTDMKKYYIHYITYGKKEKRVANKLLKKINNHK